MNTEALIHDLASECRAVKPLASPAIRFLKWAVATLAVLAAGVLMLRPDVRMGNLSDPSFVVPGFIMLCVSLFCALAAFIWTVPDKKDPRVDLILLGAIVSWFALIVYLFLAADLADSRPGYLCISRTLILALVPSAILFNMLRKAAPMRSGTVGLLASVSVLSLASFGVVLICEKAFPAHVLVWHVLPVCLLAGVGFFLGRLVFKWKVH